MPLLRRHYPTHCYYTLIRHPRQPIPFLSQSSLFSATETPNKDFPCCASDLSHACYHHYPGRFLTVEHRPFPLLWRVGTYNDVSRPARCLLTLWPAWSTDLPGRPFLEVLQPICYLLSRPKCFRLARKLAGSDLRRRIKCTLARHSQQSGRKLYPTHCSGQKELAVYRFRTRRPTCGRDSIFTGYGQAEWSKPGGMAKRDTGKTAGLAQQPH